MLLGASACGGAIALFAESAVDGSNQIAATEYSQATLRAAFARADDDSSGVLSHEEFSAVLAQCGLHLTPSELAQAREVFDPDQDGDITIDEFMAALGPFVSSSIPVTDSIQWGRPSASRHLCSGRRCAPTACVPPAQRS